MNISPSLISMYHRCSFQGYMYAFDRKRARRDNYRDVAVPSILHSLMDKWMKKAQFEKGWMAKVAESEFNSYISSHPIRWKTVTPNSQNLIAASSDEAYQRQRLINLIPVMERLATSMQFHKSDIATELWITVDFPGRDPHKLKGAADIVDWTNSIIWDLKVTESTEWLNWNQLHFYAWLMRLRYNKTLKGVGFLVPLMSPPYRLQKVGVSHINDIEATANEVLTELTSGTIPAPDPTGSACYFCDFKHQCPKYQFDPFKDRQQVGKRIAFARDGVGKSGSSRIL